MNNDNKIKVFDDLEIKLKEMMNDLDVIKDDESARDITNNFKIIAYKLTIKRLFIILKVMKRIEERLSIEIDNIEDINELMTIYKSLVKSADLLQSQLRMFFPSSQVKEYKEEGEKIDDLINSENINVKGVILNNIKDLMKMMVRVKSDMKMFDTGSVDYWKAQNSYLELLNRLNELIKTYQKLTEDESNTEVELTIDEILEVYNEIKEFEEEELSKIEEKWKEQRAEVNNVNTRNC